jgi:hypothetical protein
MSKLPTWNDFKEARPTEIKKTYKLNDRQLEMAHRKHLGGANRQELSREYDQFYRRNRRDV